MSGKAVTRSATKLRRTAQSIAVCPDVLRATAVTAIIPNPGTPNNVIV